MDEARKRERAKARAHLVATIERLMRQKELSVDDLSTRVEVDRGRIERILRGEAEADLDLIYRLAGALDAEPADLFKGITWVPPDGERAGYLVEEAEREGG